VTGLDQTTDHPLAHTHPQHRQRIGGSYQRESPRSFFSKIGSWLHNEQFVIRIGVDASASCPE